MTYVDELTERRLIAALIIEPSVLEAADGVELYDFTVPQYCAIFVAIRELQDQGLSVEPLAIDSEIRKLDEVRETTVAEKAGIGFIGALMLATEPYHEAVLWEHDMRWLRELADRRERAVR